MSTNQYYILVRGCFKEKLEYDFNCFQTINRNTRKTNSKLPLIRLLFEAINIHTLCITVWKNPHGFDILLTLVTECLKKQLILL